MSKHKKPKWLTDIADPSEYAEALAHWACNLAALHHCRGGNLGDLAEELGISRATMWCYANGRRKMPLYVVQAINGILGEKVIPSNLAPPASYLRLMGR